MRKSKAPQPVDAEKQAAWDKRLRDDPTYWGRFSLELVIEHVMAAAHDCSLPMPLVALEYILVLDEHLRDPRLVAGASTVACADAGSVRIPTWVLGALADAWGRYLAGGKGQTLNDAFTGKASKQGHRSHSPDLVRARARDFRIFWGVLNACLAPEGKSRARTLTEARSAVAQENDLDEKTVAKIYGRNLAILRPYLERVGAPVSFPD